MSARRRWVIVAVCAFGVTSVAAGTPGVLRRMEAFTVSHVEIRGTHYLEPYAALVQSGITRHSSVFDDFDAWRSRLLAHPMVLNATIERRLPNTLRVEVTETQPVALARTPDLVAVDARGKALPMNPVGSDVDVPLLTRYTHPNGYGAFVDKPTRETIAVLAMLQHYDARLYSWISEAGPMADHGTRLELRSPQGAEALLPSSPRSLKLRELQTAIADLAARGELSSVKRIDARFHDQIVVAIGK
jgi:cell division septal protein FtsQ